MLYKGRFQFCRDDGEKIAAMIQDLNIEILTKAFQDLVTDDKLCSRFQYYQKWITDNKKKKDYEFLGTEDIFKVFARGVISMSSFNSEF